MGIDVAYQAIPPDSDVLAQARVDPEWGQYLQFLVQYGSDDVKGPGRDDATFRAFVGAAQALLHNTPHLRERRLPLGRRYDQLYYLLAPECRRCEPRRDDVLTRAIFGGAVLHSAATTTQGFPIRYLARTEVERVLAALRDVDRATFEQHFDPQAMAAAGVYKIRGDEDATTLQ